MNTDGTLTYSYPKSALLLAISGARTVLTQSQLTPHDSPQDVLRRYFPPNDRAIIETILTDLMPAKNLADPMGDCIDEDVCIRFGWLAEIVEMEHEHAG